MDDPTPPQVEKISLNDLNAVISRARDEKWNELALISPDYSNYAHGKWDNKPSAPTVYLLSEPLGAEIQKLTSLSGLTHLDLTGNQIGEKGVRALTELTRLNSLILRKNQIGDEGARTITALTNLKTLNLNDNQISDKGTRAIATLTNLNSLDLWSNEIGEEGARAIAQLTSLSALNLNANQIGDEGARALAQLSGLTSLNIWNNKIGDEGARALAQLSGLTSLNIWSNNIGDEGARAIAQLSQLTSLNIGSNNIGDEGARAIAQLSGLTSLGIGDNEIGDEGARAIAQLSGLTSLGIGNNEIGDDGARAILNALSASPHADSITLLDLSANGDLSSLLPSEVLDTTDAQAILAAYRTYRDAREQQTLQPLNEAKLLVVGNEAVGKTSLIRYLVHNQPRDPNERKTPGTEIHEQIETETWAPDDCGVALNVWDFGGQEIMHGTHRFFLTERSLYLLVLEARREDDRSVYDWLKIIRNRGGDSPVIVVINKCDDDNQGLRLDEKGLKQNYPNIVTFLRTSCDANQTAAQTIAELRKQIADTLAAHEHLKHVRDPIPQPWLNVKQTVAGHSRDERVLKLQEYEQTCEQESVTDTDEQRALLRLLHDLGVVIAHGLNRNAPAALREITLLDPNWLTGAIYKLLNSKTILDQGGQFSRTQLNTLLDAELYPPERHDFILEMMQNKEVGLCYELPGSSREKYLIPEALPSSEPDYDVWPDDSLRFRFDYEFLPPGLIPRFIVQAHRNITVNPTRWRTGVVLKAADCPILVRGDRDKRHINISVTGPPERQRSALNIVLNDLEAVHDMNPEIGDDPRVPLPDDPDVTVGYNHLLILEEDEGPEFKFRPENAKRSYQVKELLDGVRREKVFVAGKVGIEKKYSINTGSNSRISIVDGEGMNIIGVDQRESDVQPPQLEDPKKTKLATFTSWHYFSASCGLGAVLLALILWLLPTNEWRAYVGAPVGIFLLVTSFMVKLDPKYFYRRMLRIVISGGILINALGFTFEAFASSGGENARFHWDGSVSSSFFIAWAIVVAGLIYGDTKQIRDG